MSSSTSCNRASCGLDVGVATDLEFSIEKACSQSYDFICSSIVDENEKVPFTKADKHAKLGGNTCSNFMLASQEWSSLVVAKISSLENLQSDDNKLRILAEKTIEDELQYSAFLGLPAVLIDIKDDNIASMAKLCSSFMLHGHHTTHVWAKIPLTSQTGNGEGDNIEVDTWKWWNKFRTLCGSHICIKVALELTADLPHIDILRKWPGEPVRSLVIPTSIFLSNKKGYPVLSKPHQHFIMKMFKLETQIIIKGPSSHIGNYRVYQQYLDYLYNLKAPPSQYESFSRGYEDYLQAPLQPLMDNLESSTYEIFERDPVKYEKYEEAVYRCLLDRVPESEVETKVTVLMVLGAGRGPIVRMALKAAKRAGRKIRCYAVEKNKSAVEYLKHFRNNDWSSDDVTVINADMRHWQPPELADVIVSELLGSFGDNELSPECLDGANRVLKPDGISIPQSYTSYLSAVSSQKLFNEVRCLVPKEAHKYKDAPFETPYVVRIHNYHELTQPQAVFTFCHPNWNLSSENKDPQFFSSDEEWGKNFSFKNIPLEVNGIENNETTTNSDHTADSTSDESTGKSSMDLSENGVGSDQGYVTADAIELSEAFGKLTGNDHNSRHKELKFDIRYDTVLHGFAGYFRCALYKDVEISIEPSTHSPGMFSWFPIFFPLRNPIQINAGDVVEANFWRCCNDQKVWYEWAVTAPVPCEIHNVRGRSYVIGL